MTVARKSIAHTPAAPKPARARALPAILAAIALPALAGCSTHDITSHDDIGYVPTVSQHLESVDWDKAEVVNVEMTEWAYRPKILHFTRGKAYRLHLDNTGIEPHDLSSKEFFQAIVVARLVGPKTTMEKPHLVSIGVDDGESKDLYFVAARTGSYYFECLEPLHAAFGMRGTAVISEPAPQS